MKDFLAGKTAIRINTEEQFNELKKKYALATSTESPMHYPLENAKSGNYGQQLSVIIYCEGMEMVHTIPQLSEFREEQYVSITDLIDIQPEQEVEEVEEQKGEIYLEASRKEENRKKELFNSLRLKFIGKGDCTEELANSIEYDENWTFMPDKEFAAIAMQTVKNAIENYIKTPVKDGIASTKEVIVAEISPTEPVEIKKVNDTRLKLIEDIKNEYINTRKIGKKFADKLEVKKEWLDEEMSDIKVKEETKTSLMNLMLQEKKFKTESEQLKIATCEAGLDGKRKYIDMYRAGSSLEEVLQTLEQDRIVHTEINTDTIITTTLEAPIELETGTVTIPFTPSIIVSSTNTVKELLEEVKQLAKDQAVKYKAGIIIINLKTLEVEKREGAFYVHDIENLLGAWSKINDDYYEIMLEEFEEDTEEWAKKKAMLIRLTAIKLLLEERG